MKKRSFALEQVSKQGSHIIYQGSEGFTVTSPTKVVCINGESEFEHAEFKDGKLVITVSPTQTEVITLPKPWWQRKLFSIAA